MWKKIVFATNTLIQWRSVFMIDTGRLNETCMHCAVSVYRLHCENTENPVHAVHSTGRGRSECTVKDEHNLHRWVTNRRKFVSSARSMKRERETIFFAPMSSFIHELFLHNFPTIFHMDEISSSKKKNWSLLRSRRQSSSSGIRFTWCTLNLKCIRNSQCDNGTI